MVLVAAADAVADATARDEALMEFEQTFSQEPVELELWRRDEDFLVIVYIRGSFPSYETRCVCMREGKREREQQKGENMMTQIARK